MFLVLNLLLVATSHGIRTTTPRPTINPHIGLFQLWLNPRCQLLCFLLNLSPNFIIFSLSTWTIIVPQNIVTWMNAKENTNYDFIDEYYSPPEYEYIYEYNSDGITGANVLSEMRPTQSSFSSPPSSIHGQNVIR